MRSSGWGNCRRRCKVEELERRANMAHVRAATAEANEIWARMERDQLKAAGGGGEGNRSKTSPTPDDDDTPRLSRWHQPGSLVAVIIAIVAILWALRVAPFLNSTADGSTATETAAPSPTLSNLTAESACEHLRSKAASSNVRAAGHEQENFNLLVLGGSGLGKDTALANLFRGQDPKWRHTALLTIRQRADTALQACNERKRLWR